MQDFNIKIFGIFLIFFAICFYFYSHYSDFLSLKGQKASVKSLRISNWKIFFGHGLIFNLSSFLKFGVMIFLAPWATDLLLVFDNMLLHKL